MLFSFTGVYMRHSVSMSQFLKQSVIYCNSYIMWTSYSLFWLLWFVDFYLKQKPSTKWTSHFLNISTCYECGCINKLNSAVVPWWRHRMETFFALLALCVGNSPVTGGLPSQRQVMRSFDVWINGWVNNREAGDLRRHRAYHDVIVMQKYF